MDIYAHAIEQNDREAADEIGELWEANNIEPSLIP